MSQTLFLGFVGANPPVWGSQPPVLPSPWLPTTTLTPYVLSSASVSGIFSRASRVPSSWCCFHFIFQHQPLPPSSPASRSEVSKDLSSAALNHLWGSCPLWSWNLQPTLGTGVSVYYASYLLLALQVHCSCQNLAPSCYVNTKTTKMDDISQVDVHLRASGPRDICLVWKTSYLSSIRLLQFSTLVGISQHLTSGRVVSPWRWTPQSLTLSVSTSQAQK